jgi:diadenosine tetraphosphate (Ap4A) HIT family hydrolase
MCPLCDRLGSTDPFRIATLDRCVVILGDNQGCPGWCTLVLRRHVEHLDDLSFEEQQAVFGEVARVARAVRACFPRGGEGGGPVRINYECLGNVVGHAHWHLVPRHANDPTPRATVWGWTPEALRGTMGVEERVSLASRIGAALTRP